MNVSDKIATGAAGVGLFSWLTTKLHSRLIDEVYNEYAKVYEPPDIVSIVIPAFNEEENIEDTLKSILSQNIILKHSDYFECIVVDNESTDHTPEIARQYCQVISAPRGKLNAKHKGIKHAVGNIIVSCDADTYYPPNWLNLILRHFYDSEVVGVHGPLLYKEASLPLRLAAIWNANLSPHVQRVFSGGNSAFRKVAYLEVGGFNLTIDQSNRTQVAYEEELSFGYRLSQVGKVVFEVRAPVFTSMRYMGSGALIETERQLTQYQEERKRGERF
jgi:glycosyltransferase involved in cell wall biosynthesis